MRRTGPHRALFRPAMTLVEVLAVVVILGLLAATLARGLSSGIGKGRREVARTGIAQIVACLELYNLERHTWPDSSTGLAALSEGAATPADAFYLGKDTLTDPWDRPFHYVRPGPDGLPFEVLSLGADGQPGGEGENADISSAALRDTQ
jgi:general secretion pathway protein G